MRQNAKIMVLIEEEVMNSFRTSKAVVSDNASCFNMYYLGDIMGKRISCKTVLAYAPL